MREHGISWADTLIAGYHALNVTIGEGWAPGIEEGVVPHVHDGDCIRATGSCALHRACVQSRASHPPQRGCCPDAAERVCRAGIALATSDERSHGLADQCDAGARTVGHTAHQRGRGTQKGGRRHPRAPTSFRLSSTFTTPTRSGREKAIGFRSTRTYQALRWQEASTSSRPKRFWEATTVSRCCFPSGRITGFRAPRSTRILAGA